MIKEDYLVRLIVLVFILSLITSCGYKDYDDCLLGEMKGQSAEMKYEVMRVCEKRFPYEKKIYAGDIQFGWSVARIKEMYNNDGVKFGGTKVLQVEIKKNDSGYRVTKAEFAFSKYSCPGATYLNRKYTFVFDGTKSTVTINDEDDFRCMKDLEVWGILD